MKPKNHFFYIWTHVRQPSEKILKQRYKKQGDRIRHCSHGVFYHDAGLWRKWPSYSLSKDKLFCTPCLMFTDTHSRGEIWRANQGNAFVTEGFSNWKKQNEGIKKHE